MHIAERAFLDQIKRDRGTNLYWLQQLAAGFRPHRDGVEITAEFTADAQRRYDLADRILAAYGHA